MALGQTRVQDLVVPQVMAQMISASLEKAIKFAPLAVIDRTLQGRPGNTVTTPKYAYIGPAVDVAEYGAIPIERMATSTAQVTIKKAGKGIELSDEAVLSGYGDPIGEANKQLRLSIADKIDNDILAAARATTALVAGSATTELSVAVDEALVSFNEEDFGTSVVLMVSPKGHAALRRDPIFDNTSIKDGILIAGQVGQYLGAQVVLSRKLNDGEAFLVKSGAFGIMMKRDVLVESDRDILHKSTIVTADEHYGAYIKDDSKLVKITHKPLA